jgi:selenocysteine-specific elongation factor
MTGHQLTVGVLGHVDHGKSALVRALTGTETDRLKEEKRRGMSIVLGFAYLETDQGSIDFVDVPGHENFIRTMISGATGIDAVLLVIAADEGVEAQTREHLAIAQLLGIGQGLIVVNKTDLADESLLAATRNEIRDAVRDTFLEDAAVYPVSAKTGDGIANLQQALVNLIAKKTPRDQAATFYLPLDRVFTVDGYGTVGTGTLRNGVIRCEDEVEVMPSSLKARIREIQVHNQQVTEAFPGQRVAVNLRGVKREQLARGQVLMNPGSVHETSCLHARLHVLNDLPRLPKRNELVRLLYGTREVLVKMRVVDASSLTSGAKLLVQFRCREPVVVGAGEHFIVRTCSPVITFGGGEILDSSERLLQMPKETLIEHLQMLEKADVEGRVAIHLQAAGTDGISLLRLAEKAIASVAQVNSGVSRAKAVIVDSDFAIGHHVFDELCEAVTSELTKFHRGNPSLLGQDLALFRAQILELCSAEIVEHLIESLVEAKRIELVGNTVRLSEFNLDDNISSSDRELIEAIEQIYKNSGAVTPSLEEVMGADAEKKRAYQYLREAGRLVSLKDSGGSKILIFHRDTIEDIKTKLAEKYPPPQRFTVSEFRQLASSSRKYVIPLLEYFDRNRFTIRSGDYRIIKRESHSDGNSISGRPI